MKEASSEDRKHTSGGVFIAVDSNLGAVVGEKEGAVVSIPGDEGIIAQAWVNVRGGLRVFSVYFWHSKGWTPRNEALLEAVLKRARVTRHPWLVAYDANMSPEEFEKKKLVSEEPDACGSSRESFHVQVKNVRRETYGLRRFTTTLLRVTALRKDAEKKVRKHFTDGGGGRL